MITISKEVDFSADDIPEADLIEVLIERVKLHTIIFNEEAKEKHKPIQKMHIDNLMELRNYLCKV